MDVVSDTLMGTRKNVVIGGGGAIGVFEEGKCVGYSAVKEKCIIDLELEQLLIEYKEYRHYVVSCREMLEEVRRTAECNRCRLWTLSENRSEIETQCHDGRDLKSVHFYKTAHADAGRTQQLHQNYKKIRQLLTESYAPYSFKASAVRMKIVDHLRRRRRRLIVDLGPVSLLRESLEALFAFQNQLEGKNVDAILTSESRTWLEEMVAAFFLHTESNFDDRLLVLRLVLQLGRGFGSWAAHLVQLPLGDGTGSQRVLSALSIMLAPPVQRRRRSFESPFSLMETANESWVILDSDDDEDLCESDLSAVLNQVPFGEIFRRLLKLETDDGYKAVAHTATSTSDLFNFGLAITEILHLGLDRLSSPCTHHQLAKKLGLLLCQTVNHLSDHWEAFLPMLEGSHRHLLQAEFDRFFLRAVLCFFSSARSGVRQYLARIPYGQVSTTTLWRILYIFHFDPGDEDSCIQRDPSDVIRVLSDNETKVHFHQFLMDDDTSDTDRQFLLASLACMVTSRAVDTDFDFVRRVALELMEIGFVDENTADFCCRDTRDLLVDIARKHPSIISFLLERGVGIEPSEPPGLKRMIYLVKALPLDLWYPSDDDMRHITQWLSESKLSSCRSHIARLIIGGMNWSISSGNNESSSRGSVRENLPWIVHKVIAICIAETAFKYCSSGAGRGHQTGGRNLLLEGFRQVSNMASVRQTPEQNYLSWAWEMLSRLHLHAMDQGCMVRRFPEESVLPFPGIYDLDLDSRVQSIALGTTSVGQQNPLACYLSLQLTQVGHCVADICDRGFKHLLVLTNYGHYDHVMECCANIFPLFLTDEATRKICESADFMKIIECIINADQTYYKMAKDLLFTDFPGPILKAFGNMMEKILSSYARYGLPDSSALVGLWLKIFVKICAWNRTKTVLYLVNLLCRHALLEDVTKSVVKSIIKEVYNQNHLNKSNGGGGGGGGGFLSWWISSRYGDMVLNVTSSEFSCFSYLVLEVEEETDEVGSLWQSIVSSLSAGSVDDVPTVEQALKKIGRSSQCLSSLMIYKWSQQILDTAIDDPLQVIFGQKFFTYYFTKLTKSSLYNNGQCVGDKLFVGIMHSMHLNRVKTKLKSIADYYDHMTTDVSNNKANLFTALHMWLDDSIVIDSNIHIPSLPACFLPTLLNDIMTEQKHNLWTTTYIDRGEILKEMEQSSSEWDRLHFRRPLSSNCQTYCEFSTSAERIRKRLCSLEPLLPPPKLPMEDSMTANCNEILPDIKGVGSYVEEFFAILSNYAETFNANNLEFNGVLCAYIEEVPHLYKNEPTQFLAMESCSGSVGPKGEKIGCAGAATVVHKFHEARKQEVVQFKMEQNFQSLENVITALSGDVPHQVAHSTHILENLTSRIVDFDGGQDVGKILFYIVIDRLSEEMSQCPPVRNLCASILDVLGHAVIVNDPDQCLPLLERIVARPLLSAFVSQFFSANDASNFLPMYRIIDQIPNCENNLAFVLLSKINVDEWLRLKSPSMMERSRLVSLLGGCLRKSGFRPTEERLLLNGIYRRHICLLATSCFPEHFGEVMGLLLILTEAQSVDPILWSDLSNALMTMTTTTTCCDVENVQTWREEMEKFVSVQSFIQLSDVLACWSLVSSHFEKERRSVGLHGLYTKYKIYTNPHLVKIFLLLSRLLMALFIKEDDGTPADVLVKVIWEQLRTFFDPWMCPRGRDQCDAMWIQQMADTQKLLMPWAPGDVKDASAVCTIFIQCVAFLHQTVPASMSAMSFLWQFYCQNFAKHGVKDYVLTVIHETFLQQDLPWSIFYPRMEDLTSMVYVVDTFLPLSHEFLGSVFIHVPWQVMVGRSQDEFMGRTISHLLHVATKLSAEPKVRQGGGRMLSLLKGSEVLPWHLVDSAVYDNLMLWYVMSVDSRVIINHDDRHPLDAIILLLLQLASSTSRSLSTANSDVSSDVLSLVSPPTSPQRVTCSPTSTTASFTAISVRKFITFVRCTTKLMVSCSNKHKAFLGAHITALGDAISKLIYTIENKIRTGLSNGVPLEKESQLLMSELLRILNSNSKSCLPMMAKKCLVSWIRESRYRESPEQRLMLVSILHCAGINVTNAPDAADILEISLEVYFGEAEEATAVVKAASGSSLLSSSQQSCGWSDVLAILSFPRNEKLTLFLEHCVSNGYGLLLYSHLRQKRALSQSAHEEEILLVTLVDWMRHLNMSRDCEPKLPLMFHEFLLLSQRQLSFGVKTTSVVVNYVVDFIQVLEAIATSGEGATWNILGAIGLASRYKPTPRAKFLALAMAYFMLGQLLEGPTLRLPSLTGATPSCSTHQDSSREEDVAKKERMNGTDPVKGCLLKEMEFTKVENLLKGLLKDHAYVGLRDLLEWTLDKSAAEDNTFLDAPVFLIYLVKNNLYTETYVSF